MVTPGKGIVPLFTVPCSLPPVTGAEASGAFDRLEPVEVTIGPAATGAEGADCARAINPAPRHIAATKAVRIAPRSIHAPRLEPVLKQTSGGQRRFTPPNSKRAG